MNELSSLQSEAEKLDELMIAHMGLYDLVLTAKNLDPDKKFMQFCKNLDVSNHPGLYVRQIHGWLIPHLAQLEAQGKLHSGKGENKIKISGINYDYDG